ncbi:MAG: hypothetical protein HY303_14310 [Candidatus Wallbacteria bacterium]|nr:hypothetical protein [Candidatus Wallbacteria bacterium]
MLFRRMVLWALLCMAPALNFAEEPAAQPESDPRPAAEVVAGLPARSQAAPASAVPVSLFRFNTADSRERIAKRSAFCPVFMGMAERDGHVREILALRLLVEDPAICLASPRLLRSVLASTRPEASRLPEEMAALKDWIETRANAPEFSNRYLSYAGEGGSFDPDFLVYTSPHPFVAHLYGEIVLEIREQTPRGVDLNELNRAVYDYYRKLTLAQRLNPKAALIRALLDRDEYVIPSHLPASDIAAADVYARLPVELAKGNVRLTGRLQRHYQRRTDGRHTWVDLLDRAGLLMARFSRDPSAPAPTGSRSTATLPPEVARDAAVFCRIQ